MKKRKLFPLIVSLSLAAILLCACSNNAANNESGKNAYATDPDIDFQEDAAASKTPAGGELSLFTWDGMFPQEVLDGFEEETGIRIYFSNFALDEDMLAKLEETKGGDYDLVIADDYIIETAITAGLVQPLDTSKLSNWGNINPLFQKQFYDPEDKYTVPYGAGIPLIVYDPALIDFEIKGYEDLWNPALKDSVAIMENYRVVNGMALKIMGESFNTTATNAIQEAGDKLLGLAPNIRLINDSNTQDYIISGEVSAAYLYTSQVSMALTERPDLKSVFPKEGVGFGIMAGFIPSQAPNAEAAHLFLDYILRPEIAAKCFEFIGYYSTNKAADELISPEMRDMLTVPDSVKQGEIIQNISAEAEEAHIDAWTKFKSECE